MTQSIAVQAAFVSGIASLIAASLAGFVSVFVFARTASLQRDLKRIDETLKTLELRFSYFRLCAEQAEGVLNQISSASLADFTQSSVRIRLLQLRALLNSITPLTQVELDVLNRSTFPLESDFTGWKTELVELTYGRLTQLSATFR